MLEFRIFHQQVSNRNSYILNEISTILACGHSRIITAYRPGYF